MNFLKLKLTEDSYVNDLVISVVMCLSMFAFYFLYQWLPTVTIALLIGVPVTIIFARWLKIWQARESQDEPGPFSISLPDESIAD